MTIDLDATELRAMRFQKLNPLHECFDSITVLALIGELRQERERADDLLTANAGLVDAVYATDADLSRAEETIEKVLDHDPLHGKPEGLHCGGMSPCIRGILTEYDKQKGAKN